MLDKVKIVVLGYVASGKTSLINVYFKNRYDEYVNLTNAADVVRKKFSIDEMNDCNVVVWDTPGIERLSHMTEMFRKGANGVMVVYDVTDSKSLVKAEEWLNKLRSPDEPFSHLMLVGCKSDLVNERQITHKQGKALAERFTARFYEVSAKNNHNVATAFEELARTCATSGLVSSRPVINEGQEFSVSAAASSLFNQIRSAFQSPSPDASASATSASEQSEDLKYDHLFKILLIGNENAGVSNVFIRIEQGHTSNIAASFRTRLIPIEGQVYKLFISSYQVTPLSPPLSAIKPDIITRHLDCDGVILLYNINNPESFEYVKNLWLNRIKNHPKLTSGQVVLAGNERSSDEDTKIVISTPQGQALANEIGCEFVEISSRRSTGVEEALLLLTQKIKKKNDEVNNINIPRK
jgi:small GTP-binding protein